MTPTLLILRPEPGAAATAARAAQLGLAAVVAPLFKAGPVGWAPPDPAAFDAVMLTSANAVRHAGTALASYLLLPTYAVGAGTAEAAKRAGFTVAATGDADAAMLLERIAADGVRRPLHLAGREHRAVRHPLVATTVAIVYAAEPVAQLSLVPGAHHVALLHSPRAGALYRSLVAAAGLAPAGLAIAAISPAALAAAGDGWARSAVALNPTDDALLAAAARLCD